MKALCVEQMKEEMNVGSSQKAASHSCFYGTLEQSLKLTGVYNHLLKKICSIYNISY